MPCFVQDAKKGVLFDSFPPVLQLQLKRFEYDFQRDVMVKVRPPFLLTGLQCLSLFYSQTACTSLHWAILYVIPTLHLRAHTAVWLVAA